MRAISGEYDWWTLPSDMVTRKPRQNQVADHGKPTSMITITLIVHVYL